MSDSEDSAVTYTSVYTDSEPERVFWGTDEEVSKGGVPRVIVYGYDGFLIQPIPQDERKPRFIQAHDLDFVPEPVYPKYIPLEDEHVLSAEEQLLPHFDLPTTESPRYVAESDPKEDPKYEDDEEQDGPVDYPMGKRDDGGDDDGDSSRDDAADEDEEEDEEEEHNSFGRLHRFQLQAFVSLPSTVDVERLLALPTPPLSPLISLSPPFVGEHLARLTDSSVHPSPLLLPSSGYRRDEIPKSERPPRKRSCLFTIGSRDVGYGIRDTWIDPAEAFPVIVPTTVEEVNTRVVELAELHEHNIQDFHALIEDAQDGRSRISQRVDKNSQQLTETLRVVRDIRREMSDMQKELISQRELLRRERQPRPDARFPDHQEVTGDTESHP
nr:hypothetical protein [Tanacetum cinerariifolium]